MAKRLVRVTLPVVVDESVDSDDVVEAVKMLVDYGLAGIDHEPLDFAEPSHVADVERLMAMQFEEAFLYDDDYENQEIVDEQSKPEGS